jgi:hypothetical protein
MGSTWESLRLQAADADLRAAEALIHLEYAERTWETPEDRQLFLHLARRQLIHASGSTVASRHASERVQALTVRELEETAHAQRWAASEALRNLPEVLAPVSCHEV